MLLNNQELAEEIKEEIKKYLETNDNENKIYILKKLSELQKNLRKIIQWNLKKKNTRIKMGFFSKGIEIIKKEPNRGSGAEDLNEWNF